MISGEIAVQATIRPTDHLALDFVGDRQWLNVRSDEGRSGRLFTAQVTRVKTTYTFSARSFLRLIGQYVKTDRDPSLYTFTVPQKSAPSFWKGSISSTHPSRLSTRAR